jgi:AcrR family transcriptional regulator
VAQPAQEAVVSQGQPASVPGTPAGTASRRDRLRAATTAEIIQTARRLLVESGPQAVSLRAIAREMGMTAPGLYRYFDSHEELIRHVVADIFTGLHGTIKDAIHAVVSPPPDADAAERSAHMAAKTVAACRAFRAWALDNPGEFGMIFGVPLPGYAEISRNDIAEACAQEFAATFYGLFVELWQAVRFPVPGEDEIDPSLRAQLEEHYSQMHDAGLPAGAHLVFLRCWSLLYGAVAIEVFGHLNFALTDASPLFEYTLADLARMLGLRYPPATRPTA